MGYLYTAFFAAFLYLAPVILLCVKVADKTTAKTGWAMAFLLVVFPVVLLAVGAVIDAKGAAS